MTEEELTRLESLEKAATPGPWGTTRYSGGLTFNGPLRLYSGTSEEFGEPNPIRLEDEANIYFIAAARNALPELIAEIRRLRAAWQTGIGRATWSTGDEAQYQSGAFTITETDGASNQ